ncbi:plant UBX domain-containing protein 2 [Phalaenopsis equestris]|uniref:plant UBX domain-containing protein 2 n=1 Tax=Phalaenopsis equestris TaxID=78828 RepID=UPI0009E1D191|nr:plant UBX domain-containing protein 2 [Phalaenopsis equestris]
MEDVKGKMKGLIKKVNNPFSSSSSAFKGQGRVLGSATSSSSSSSSPSNSTCSRSIPPPRPSITANRSPPGFDPYEPLVASGKRSTSAATTVECPICSSSFPSEESVSAHLDSCIGPSADAGSDGGVAKCVSAFLSGEPAEGSAETAIKLLGNVFREPSNEKFRKIRMGNPRIKEAIGEVIGGVELLECVGFRIREEDGEKWATMGELTPESIAVIEEAILLMERWTRKDASAAVNGTVERLDAEKEKKPKTIDRKIRVFFAVPESVAAKIDLPDSFYNLSIEELKRESEARKKKIADSQLLIPRSYKEKQAMAARKKYKLTVIRIQFPDGVVLQGLFLPWERTNVLYEFVRSALKDPSLEFELLSPAMSRVHLIPRSPGPDGSTPTLEEEDLVPSILIKFKPIETDSIVFTGLANKFLELIEPLTTATTVL